MPRGRPKKSKVRVINDIRTLKKVIKSDEAGWFEYQGKALFIGYRHGKDDKGMDRKQRTYWERRKLGQCVKCGKPVKKTNPQTGKLYRLCEKHRKQIDTKK